MTSLQPAPLVSRFTLDSTSGSLLPYLARSTHLEQTLDHKKIPEKCHLPTLA